MNLPKVITLCADDYGYSESVSHAIVELANQQRLTAISCMTTAPRWPVDALPLKSLVGRVDLGLHLNLTEKFQNGQGYNFSLPGLILRAYARVLSRKKLRATIEDQWQRFIDHVGVPPDFIDGHQHVHQLPQIRDELCNFIATRATDTPIYVRNTARQQAASNFQFKSFIVDRLGGATLSWKLRGDDIPTNTDFLGVYNFTEADYRELMREWLLRSDPGSLIMCHPALPNFTEKDPIAIARSREYQYLASSAFSDDLAEAGVRLERFAIQ